MTARFVVVAILVGLIGWYLAWTARAIDDVRFYVGIVLLLIAVVFALAGGWAFWTATLGRM